MRSSFPGYYSPNEDEFSNAWEKGTFIFDTNTLLNLYRYSDETVNTMLDVMESIKNRIWIPHQVAIEYHKNIYSIISSQASSYSDTIKLVKELETKLESSKSHPFLSRDFQNKAQRFFKQLNTELSNNQNKVLSSLKTNNTKDRLADILENKLGNAFSVDELEEIYSEGENRYSHKVPPGYMDAKDKPGNEKYGDLIIWKEILKYSKNSNNAIIFITSDTKEDWFLSEKKQIIGPRPELVAEMKRLKNIFFYCYPTHIFLSYANKYLSAQAGKDTLEEVKEFEQKPSPLEGELLNSADSKSPLSDMLKAQEAFNTIVQDSLRGQEALRKKLSETTLDYLQFAKRFNSVNQQINSPSQALSNLFNLSDKFRLIIDDSSSQEIANTSASQVSETDSKANLENSEADKTESTL